jgi:hypothetical protein
VIEPAVAAFILFTASPVALEQTPVAPTPVQNCEGSTLARSGFGVSYEGVIENERYHMKVTIPRGLIGWGAAPEAPFHGFAVFLPGEDAGCIGLRIQLRIDTKRTESASERHRRAPVQIGNVLGLKDERVGVVKGVSWTNIALCFAVDHDTYADDGCVWLAAPTAYLVAARDALDQLLAQLHFETP